MINTEGKNILQDSFGRKIDYLRMSVTDRCNLRCIYCMPASGIKMLGHEDMLTYEELLRAAKLFSELGIKKIRLTGGEPLVRKDIITLVKGLKKLSGIEDISLTTNGLLLGSYLRQLKDTGVKRLNISIDSMDPGKYAKITRGGNLRALTDNIIGAVKLGFKEIKLNVVITHFLDSSDIRDFINFSRDYHLYIRFIEMMDYEAGNCGNISTIYPTESSRVECCSSYITDSEKKLSVQNIIEIIKQYGKYEKVKKSIGFGPSVYYSDKKSRGYIGFIINDRAACSYCNRLRLTSEGRVRLCLFSDIEYDLKKRFRGGSSDELIKSELKIFIKNKPENREESCILNPGLINTGDVKINDYRSEDAITKINADCNGCGKRDENFKSKKTSNVKLKKYMNKIGG